MQYRIFKVDQLDNSLWEAFHKLRDDDATRVNPLFDPHFAKVLSLVRPDTRVVVVFQSDSPVAFWPLHRRSSGWTRPLGGPFSDWQGPIVKTDVSLSEAELLRGAGLSGMTVTGLRPRSLKDVPENSLTRTASHFADISSGIDMYLEEQSLTFPKHFKKMSRLRRKIEREHESLEFNFDERSPDAFEWIIARKQMQLTQSGKHNVLGVEWAQRFLDIMWHEPSPTCRLHLSTMRIDGQIAAAELNFCSLSQMHGWLVGFDPKFASLSPGQLLLQEIICHLPSIGVEAYDLGANHYYYKKPYSNCSIPIDVGVIDTNLNALLPHRLVGKSWRFVETRLSGRVNALMGKTRRRLDQIVISETELEGRIQGVLLATKNGLGLSRS